MKTFAALIHQLDQSNKTSEKILALSHYFETADDEDKLPAIYLLFGRKVKRSIPHRLLRETGTSLAGIPEWLFEECYQSVGDIAETIALLVPGKSMDDSHSLKEWLERIMTTTEMEEPAKVDFLIDSWQQLDSTERFVFNKLITGGFRIGVSKKTVINALSRVSDIPAAELMHRLAGNWDPFRDNLQDLLYTNRIDTDLSLPYPFYLAHPLEGSPDELGSPNAWQAEWKWDGIRGQVIKRKGEAFIWSRGEELVNEQFPDLVLAVDSLPDHLVLDGEILAWKDGKPMPFQALQKRLGRKNPGRKILQDTPVVFMVYDVLEYKGKDVRSQPFHKRQELMREIINHAESSLFLASEPVIFRDWDALHSTRKKSRSRGTEGIMLKRKDSPYRAGRVKGDWWKWKVDPYTIDAVLVYAQKGHGRRANLFTDYTFAVWDGDQPVVFTKAYSGLTDAEFREVDAFVRKHTLEKFGPVRTVTPELVFEIAFEGIAESKRHKSGVALRFPRMHRWRKDKHAHEANTLKDLKDLLNNARYSGFI